VLSEAPPAVAYVGGVLCLAGVALARRGPRPRAPITQEVTAPEPAGQTGSAG